MKAPGVCWEQQEMGRGKAFPVRQPVVCRDRAALRTPIRVALSCSSPRPRVPGGISFVFVFGERMVKIIKEN